MEDLWLHLALVLGEGPGVLIGVMENTLKSSILANGANISSVVMVLVATVAMLIVLVPQWTNSFFGFKKQDMFDLSDS